MKARVTLVEYHQSFSYEDGPGSTTNIDSRKSPKYEIWSSEVDDLEVIDEQYLLTQGVHLHRNDEDGLCDRAYTLEQLVEGRWAYVNSLHGTFDEYDDYA